MTKKLGLLMAAVAVLAFAIPAMAGAAPSVTSKAGTLAALNTTITATNVGHVLTTGTPLGTLTCGNMTFSAKLTENTGTKFTGNNGSGAFSICNVGGNPLTKTDLTITHLESTVANSGKVNFSYISDLPGGVVCTFTGTNVPFTYVTGSSHITFTEAKGITGSPALCNSANLRIDATFTIEIGSTHVILD